MKKEKANEASTSKEPKVIPEEAVEKQLVKEAKPAKVTKVGALLKEMRLQKGLKTPDISKKLCIRKCYLDAIEESNYNEIPAFPYGIGFIRSYANFLGLNGENIVELYKEETNMVELKDMHMLEPQPEASMPGWQYLVASLVAIAALYAGWVMYNKNETALPDGNGVFNEQNITKSDNDGGVIIVEDFNFELPTDEISNSNDNETTENVDQQINISNENYVEPQPETTVDQIKEKPVEAEESEEKIMIPQQGVFIEVLKETWVEVKDDNRLYISKVLQTGDTYIVPESTGMILSVGKVDGVNVYINGTLTKVVRPGKKTNIALDTFLKNQN